MIPMLIRDLPCTAKHPRTSRTCCLNPSEDHRGATCRFSLLPCMGGNQERGADVMTNTERLKFLERCYAHFSELSLLHPDDVDTNVVFLLGNVCSDIQHELQVAEDRRWAHSDPSYQGS